MRALIDCDVLRYSIGFASEKTTYLVLLKGEEHHGPVATFQKKSDATEWMGEGKEYVLDVKVEASPLSYCLHSLNLNIESIIKETKATSYIAFLSGKGNFRDSLATLRPYKGNRDASHKPIYYNDITKYLIHRYNAVVVNGKEADDAIATAHSCSVEETVICSIDKDLRQVPGYYYNFSKKELSFISQAEADLNFFSQVLSGDYTDNIPGIAGLGPKTATKKLENCKTREDMYLICVQEYLNSIDKDHPSREQEAMRQLDENAALLYLLRSEGDSWLAYKKTITEGIFKPSEQIKAEGD